MNNTPTVDGKISTSIEISGIKMKNPVMTASGTFGYGSEYKDFVSLDRLGAICVKGITLDPWEGNPTPRIAETPAGMLNSIGLQNVGVEKFIDEKLPYLRKFDLPVFVNVCGKQEKEYVEVVDRLSQVDGISAIELNISCPNLECGGISFGVDPRLTFQLVEKVRSKTKLPVFVKLSPNVTDITEIAIAAESAGADGISAINTLIGMRIDIKTRRPMTRKITAGLSGPAIRPIAVRMVWQVFNAVKIPIIGMGGIMSAEDAVEFLIAGASAVAIGTANFINPRTTVEVIEGIENYMKNHDIKSIGEIIGSLDAKL